MPVVKKKLPVSVKSLLKFDPEYFDYLDPANQSAGAKAFYKKSTSSKEKLYSHLATYVFDHDDNYGMLLRIADLFGSDVMREVIVKLSKRDHDT